MAKLENDGSTADVSRYVEAITDPAIRKDVTRLLNLMQEVTGCYPEMWGSGIIGCGSYHYKYASGHEGDTCLIGLSARRQNTSVYLAPGILEDKEMLKKLGNVKAGKGCLYIKQLDQVDQHALKELFEHSVRTIRERFATGSS